jgi:hypothetical protein
MGKTDNLKKYIDIHNEFLKDLDYTKFIKNIKTVTRNRYKTILKDVKKLFKEEQLKIDILGIYNHLRDDDEVKERFYDECVKNNKHELLTCLYSFETRKDNLKKYLESESIKLIKGVDYKKIALFDEKIKDKEYIERIPYKNDNMCEFNVITYKYLKLRKNEEGYCDFVIDQTEEIFCLTPLTVLGLYNLRTFYLQENANKFTLIHGIIDPNLMYFTKKSDNIYKIVEDSVKFFLFNTPYNILFNLVYPYSLMRCLWFDGSDKLTSDRLKELLELQQDYMTKDEVKNIKFIIDKLEEVKKDIQKIK